MRVEFRSVRRHAPHFTRLGFGRFSTGDELVDDRAIGYRAVLVRVLPKDGVIEAALPTMARS